MDDPEVVSLHVVYADGDSDHPGIVTPEKAGRQMAPQDSEIGANKADNKW